jgi:hypothetical protein
LYLAKERQKTQGVRVNVASSKKQKEIKLARTGISVLRLAKKTFHFDALNSPAAFFQNQI